jgi:hypothetical protein
VADQFVWWREINHPVVHHKLTIARLDEAMSGFINT